MKLAGGTMEIELKIVDAGIFQKGGFPVLMMEPDGKKEDALAVWCHPLILIEIKAVLDGIETDGLHLHDVLKAMMDSLGATLKKTVVFDFKDNHILTMLHLECGEKAYTAECNPIHAIALAQLTKSPIYIESEVLEKLRADHQKDEGSDKDDAEGDSADDSDIIDPSINDMGINWDKLPKA